jgi:hypothetical protein
VKEKLQKILAEYGPIAVVVYLAIFFTVLFAAWSAIHLGWRPDSVAANVGTFTAAYLFTKITQPVRIALTLVLTPILSRVVHRFRPERADPPSSESPPSDLPPSDQSRL